MQRSSHPELDELEEIAGVMREAGAYSPDYSTLVRQGRVHWLQASAARRSCGTSAFARSEPMTLKSWNSPAAKPPKGGTLPKGDTG